MSNPLVDPEVAYSIGYVFGIASEKIRERRERSLKRASIGMSEYREETDMNSLIDAFETSVKDVVDDVVRQSAGGKASINVEFHANRVASEEQINGADFGVRLHAESSSYNISKAILFQCKRVYMIDRGRSIVKLNDKDARNQAERMLNMTPASFFMIFSSEPCRKVLDWNRIPFWSWLQWDELRVRPPSRFAKRGDRDFLAAFAAMMSTGVMILPAARVYGEARGRGKGRKGSRSAEYWLSDAVPLGVFMASALGACFVGDVREDILRIVTPPKLRKVYENEDDASMFSVQRIMDIFVRQGNKQRA